MTDTPTIDDYIEAAAQRLAKLYQLEKCTDRELGRRMGLSNATVSAWRRGKTFPDDATMQRLAELADMNVPEALAWLGVWRNDGPVAATYETMARRLGRTAAAFFHPGLAAGAILAAAVAGAAVVKPLPAAAAVHGTLPEQSGAQAQSNLYYGKPARGLWRRVLRKLAKALRWAAVAAALGLGALPATAETPTAVEIARAAAGGQPDPDHKDPWGRVYPALCSRAALAAVDIPVVRVSQGFLDKATRADRRFGVFLPTGAMAIRRDLEGEMLQAVKDHEACHWLMREVTGSPAWHD